MRPFAETITAMAAAADIIEATIARMQTDLADLIAKRDGLRNAVIDLAPHAGHGAVFDAYSNPPAATETVGP